MMNLNVCAGTLKHRIYARKNRKKHRGKTREKIGKKESKVERKSNLTRC